MTSYEFLRRVLQLLELMDRGSRLARSQSPTDPARMAFYSLKDQAMAYLYELLKDTDAVAYHKIPFLRRCVGCKRKADDAHHADPSRSWEHHLNALPPCPSDIEDLDQETISMTVQWLGRNFNFHAPRREGLKWGLVVDKLPVKSWTPEDEFRSLQKVVEDLTPVLYDLRTWTPAASTSFRSSR